MEAEDRRRMRMRKVVLILSSFLLVIGNSGAPLTMRLYFIHGGKRIWLTSWLQTAAFPIMLIPLSVSYLRRTRQLSITDTEAHKPKLISMEKLPLFLAAACIGILTGLIDYLLAYGAARLPLSTGAMLAATQLGFTAAFAYLLVKQKFTFYSINAVALLTVGAAVLAFNSNGDRPAGESNKQYVMGFVVMLLASALFGLTLPLIELAFKRAKQAITWLLVMEMQFVMSFFATLFCTVGMLINNDFKAIPREARNYELGETKYYAVLVCSGFLWQMSLLGMVGVIFSASSLLSGITISVLLPVTEVLAVIFLKEKFQAEKGIALALSVWGFISYFYGELKQSNRSSTRIHNPETELSHLSVHP